MSLPLFFLNTLLTGSTPEPSWFDLLPPLRDFFALLCGLALILLMAYFVRTAARTGSRDFVIHVDADDISFSGGLPPQLQATVIDFLRNDIAVQGRYRVRGHWNEGLLIVTVKGDNARPLEQRIRNFLKLNLKPPRQS